MAVSPASLPLLNPLGHDTLLGLLYRALAADADPAQAQLTLRRIEHCSGEFTVASQRRSQLRGAVEIAQSHALNARREASRIDLDLQLFTERYPQQRKRGLFLPRHSPEQLQIEQQRSELQGQLNLAREDASQLQAKLDELSRQAALVDKLHARLSEDREELNQRFRQEVAAGVLSLVALGEVAHAREVLADGRRMLRGDLVLGCLWVLMALLDAGPAAAARELKETHLIWEQHPDPVARILEAYLKLLRGEQLNRQALGIFPRGNFTHPSLWRLYLLLGALAGWPPEHGQPDCAGLESTLRVLWQWRSQHGQAAWELRDGPLALAKWAGTQDLVCRLTLANLLLRCGLWREIPWAAGFSGLADIEPLHYIPRPKRSGQAWPALLPLLAKQELSAWPLPLRSAWSAGLACHVLLAAEQHAPPELFAQWLEESQGWPVSNLHWWTQAKLRHNPGLLNNLRSEAAGLFDCPAG